MGRLARYCRPVALFALGVVVGMVAGLTLGSTAGWHWGYSAGHADGVKAVERASGFTVPQLVKAQEDFQHIYIEAVNKGKARHAP